MPPKKASAKKNGLKFHQRLVLNQWLLDLFEVSCWEDLITDTMKRPECEGFDENNVSHFYHELTRPLFSHPRLTNDQLLRYDENIFHHTAAVNARRSEPLRWKYFQYLALLFTEIYLDRYFDNPSLLLDELNDHVTRFNNGKWPPQPNHVMTVPVATADAVDKFSSQDLRKLAFWMATGAGKTLIMHVNILQYRFYLQRHGREGELNRTILLTPNEGLSIQHLREFEAAGIEAELFSKDQGSLFRGHAIEIIDIHKLRETMGEKTVAVDAFEGNNLVLVDEGHRGASGLDWKDKRDRLCATGFSFEYSATFGQAMRAAKKPELTQEYCKSVLFDYSYRYFYRDGYGKDYRILNLPDDHDQETNNLYLTACLLAFYQQQRLYHDKERDFRPFLLEKPLWVFVGHTVTRKRGEDQEVTSDEATLTDAIVVLKFLAGFIKEKQASVARLRRLLSGDTGLVDRGNDIFSNAFPYLAKLNLTPEQAFDDVLKHLFNAPNGGLFYVENLKGVDGEIALRVGDSGKSFGLINVGDDAKLCKLCEEHEELHVREPEFSQSHFAEIANEDSPVNVLIGAKKFTEGWNSWRVSTMGLLNVGRNEGSEIIQLFGRGVRLRGHDNSLRRSTRLGTVTPPDHVRILETLSVFGIRAAYMQQFKDYLEEEGLPTEDDRECIILPTIPIPKLPSLKIVDVKQGFDYKRDAPKPTLSDPADRMLPVVVNWYPKVQARESSGAAAASTPAQLNEEKLTDQHVAFLNIDALYFDLQQYKNERGWHNLNIPKSVIGSLLQRRDWYSLLIPQDEMRFDSFRKVRRWEEIAGTLLRKYCDRYYNRHKELHQPLEVREILPNEPNCDVQYRVLVDRSLDAVVAQLHQLKDAIGTGSLWDVSFTNPHAIVFDRHLYAPLMTVRGAGVEVSPVSLNQGESDFVRDLKAYSISHSAFLADKHLYLLRNQSRGTGIGFAEANNFYPDFILWLIIGDHQFIAFIDPKGLLHVDGPGDPKIQFRHTVKSIEQRMADASITLNSCILATTMAHQLPFWAKDRDTLANEHVFFQDDQDYLTKLLRVACSD